MPSVRTILRKVFGFTDWKARLYSTDVRSFFAGAITGVVFILAIEMACFVLHWLLQR